MASLTRGPHGNSPARDAFSQMPALPSSYDRQLSVAQNLAMPLVRQAWAQLEHTVSAEMRLLLSSASADALKGSLVNRLTFTGQQVIDFVLSASRTTPGLFPSAGQQMSEQDCAKVFFSRGVEPELQSLLRRYPAFAQVWAMQSTCWLKFICAFLSDTQAFITRRRHRPKRHSGTIRKIVPDLSDLHFGGKAVLRVGFNNGEDWIYKPRCGEAERWFFDLLKKVNRLGFSLPFQTVKLVGTDMHHWMQFVEHRECRTRNDAERFFYRAGALLYLVHLLRGVDFHAGNLVAHGSHPVIVDCETLLHPATPLPPSFKFEEGSIFRTGMLPLPQSCRRDPEDVSAFGRHERGLHSVVSEGQTIPADQHVDEIVAGFQEMHDLLTSARRKSCAICKMIASPPLKSCRVIRRPTVQYYALLKRSLDPAYLEDSSRRRFFLVSACRERYITRRQLVTEVAALQRADIPLFRARISHPRPLGNNDLSRAIQCIRRAFTTSTVTSTV